MSRQITKNPQNLLQNFHPSQQQQSNGYGFNNFPLSPSGNSGNGSSSGGSSGMMHGSASTSRLSSLMSGGGSNFSSFGGNDLESSGSGSNFSGNSGGAHYSGSRSMYNESRSSNNGFSGMIGGGGGGGGSGSGFERSMSSGYDSHHHNSGPERGGFDRQMSVPNNLPQPKFPVQNGFNGRSDGFNNRSSDGFNNRPDGFNNRSDGFNNRPSGFGSEQPRPMMSSNNDSFFGGNNMFGRSGSPNQMNGGSRPGFNDMKIGTWNEGGARYVFT